MRQQISSLFFVSLLASLLLGMSFSSYAQTSTSSQAYPTHYVSENLKTYLRKGPSDQFKISGTITAGEKITLIERKERYSLIRDSKNREAWILNSELTTIPSSKELTPKLQQQVQELSLKLQKIDQDWQQRTTEMQRRTIQAQQQSHDLIEQNARLKQEINILKNKNRELEAFQDTETREIMIQYFIYGGSVLFVGLLIGLLMSIFLPKRRSHWNH